jgi:TrmH family RNA methyltransferase
MITSRQNRKVKNIRRLRRCKGDHAILEGPHLLAEALEADLELDEILATEAFIATADFRRLQDRLPRRPILIEPAVLDSLCDADSPRGVLAITNLPRGGLEAVMKPLRQMLIVAEGLQDPGNLGALARVAEAAGADGLALTRSSVHPNHSRALRASAGSLLRLPVAVDIDIDDLRSQYGGISIVALAAHDGEDLYDFEPGGPFVLLVGAEGPGLSRQALTAADRLLTIPLAAGVESLNVAVAVAVAMFEVRRRWRT